MTPTDYLLNGLLVALVIRQIRGRRITPLSLVWPLAVVAYFGHTYLHAFPTAGNDLWLSLGGPILGLTLGVLCGLFTRITPDREGQPFAKAGVAAASLWIVGVGARLAFELYATHGGGPSIARFSASHHITSIEAWVTGLVLMSLAEVLGRNGVLGLRSFRVRQQAIADGIGTAPAHSPEPSGIMAVRDRAF